MKKAKKIQTFKMPERELSAFFKAIKKITGITNKSEAIRRVLNEKTNNLKKEEDVKNGTK